MIARCGERQRAARLTCAHDRHMRRCIDRGTFSSEDRDRTFGQGIGDEARAVRAAARQRGE